jgi:hypothetical protein
MFINLKFQRINFKNYRDFIVLYNGPQEFQIYNQELIDKIGFLKQIFNKY